MIDQRSRADKVFESDEMMLRNINPDWTSEQLLSMDGIFYLKDVVGKLQLTPEDCKKRACDLETEGKSAWEEMGLRKAWTHWIVRMKRFREYINNNTMPRIRQVEDSWDGNTLLAQKGQFYLTEVCEKIPFSAHQIRHQARLNKRSKEDFGVWKDQGYKTYIVEMEVFSKWIRSIWSVALNE